MMSYFKMKKQEWKVKSMFYGTVLKLADEHKDIIGLAKMLYKVLKDVPPEDLRKELITAVAEIVHAENQENKENGNV